MRVVKWSKHRNRLAAKLRRLRTGQVEPNIPNYQLTRGIKEVGDQHGLRMLEEVERLIAKHGFIRVLDIGCGYGSFLAELKGRFGDKVEVHGVDIMRRPQWAAHGSKINFHVAHAENLRLPDNHFHLVLATSSIYRTKNFLKALKESKRGLAPGGLMAVNFYPDFCSQSKLDAIKSFIRKNNGRLGDCWDPMVLWGDFWSRSVQVRKPLHAN